VFVRGTTEGINLIAKSWGAKHIGAGDEIIVSNLEHHANIVPCQQLAAEKGATIRVIPVDASGQVQLDAYQRLLSDKTKIVAVTQVSNALGTVVPVKQIVDLPQLDADFFVFAGHKIIGPTGIGVVYGKREVLQDMPPWQGGGNIADAVGLGVALEYVERIGIEPPSPSCAASARKPRCGCRWPSTTPARRLTAPPPWCGSWPPGVRPRADPPTSTFHPYAMSDRQADFPIDPQFTRRWSPRAFSGEPIEDATLRSFLEAARWAPSGFNAQPWRFIYGRAGTPAWAPIFDSLSEDNHGWAQRASALVLTLSRTRWLPPGKDELQPNATHAFDAGAAWGYLALQVTLAGWYAHGIGGFDRDKARAQLAIPDDYQLHAVVAIGRLGDKSLLPEALQARELPNQRLPLAKLAAEGRFAFVE
jgi:nitroreductase